VIFGLSAGRTAAACGLAVTLGLHIFLFPVSARTAQTFPTLTSALDAMGLRYKVHFGLEYSQNDQDKTPITLDLSADNVNSVLNDLIGQKPEYQWSIRDGVYDLFPKQNLVSLLDAQIRFFSIENASLKEASKAIDELPEVRDWLAKQGVTRRELELGSSNQSPDLRVSLTLTGVTLRCVLNRLVKVMGGVDWIVVRYGEKQQYIAIYL
jgi:hypothetical protein